MIKQQTRKEIIKSFKVVVPKIARDGSKHLMGYEDSNKILEMGNNANKYALENLTWKASARIFLEHIN